MCIEYCIIDALKREYFCFVRLSSNRREDKCSLAHFGIPSILSSKKSCLIRSKHTAQKHRKSRFSQKAYSSKHNFSIGLVMARSKRLLWFKSTIASNSRIQFISVSAGIQSFKNQISLNCKIRLCKRRRYAYQQESKKKVRNVHFQEM